MTDFQTAVTGLKLYADRIARVVVLVETITEGKWSEGRALDCLAALEMLDGIGSMAYPEAVQSVFGVRVEGLLSDAHTILTDKVAAWTLKAGEETKGE